MGVSVVTLRTVGVALVLLVCLVRIGESGECCRASYNIIKTQASSDQKWCDDYCCFMVYKYDCCDDYNQRAPEDMRMPMCVAWFQAYWYIPVLIVLAVVGGIICCVCCVCCRNRSNGAIMVPPPQSSMLIVTQQQPQVNDQSSSNTNQYNVGYDQ
ncbi:uncharacterized protein LOC132560225 [Ylistrum balloti]|uniref:uncharacterized protein LOC132560225 n=1 Tax=Ylistrum balloti TaxID=509963 RepID=UPI0029057E71|nr:uncharacterized protein LOC132560225 [Ylistrum balloti]